MMEDGEGGVFVVWLDYNPAQVEPYRVAAQRLNGMGEKLWGPEGVTLADNYNDWQIFLVADGQGGFIVLWVGDSPTSTQTHLVQRLDGNGNTLWETGGMMPLAAPDLLNALQCRSDGVGGIIMVWNDFGNIIAQRISASGDRLWGPAGSAVYEGPGFQPNPQLLVGDDSRSLYIWEDEEAGSLKFQFKDETGFNLNFDAYPIIEEAGASFHQPQIISAPGHDYYLIFQRFITSIGNRIQVQRFQDMSASSLWAQPLTVRHVEVEVSSIPVGLIDPLTGDLVVTWHDDRNNPGIPGNDVFIQRVSNSGSYLYSYDGLLVCDQQDSQYNPRLTIDSEGYAVVAWMDSRLGETRREIYAQRISPIGVFMWEETGHSLFTHGGFPITQLPTIVAEPSGGTLISQQDAFATPRLLVHRVEPTHGFGGRPEPHIDNLADVAGDQGGHLRVEWSASPYDTHPDQEISHYSIWRATSESVAKRGLPVVAASRVTQDFEGEALRLAVGEDFYWEYVGQQGALQFSHYGFDVPTLADSTSVDDALLYVQVVAHGWNNGVTFASAPDSARSTDDLAPEPIQTLLAQRNPDGSVDLVWNRVGDGDLRDYSVFRAGGSQVDPEPAFLIAATMDTTLTDLNAPVGEQLAYVVAAVDVHENQGQASNMAVVGTASAVDQAPQLRLAITQAVPNPFNPSTTIHFSLDQAGPVRLRIYDVHGRLVRTLADENRVAGMHSDVWQGRDDEGKAVSSGVYFARVETADGAAVRKLLLAK